MPDTAVDSDSEKQSRRSVGMNLGRVVGLSMALIGSFIGATPLSDNSLLTHLATGREMIAEGFVRSDVFTWTSQGREVVVQSWLASLLYGVVEQVGGFGALRLLMAGTAGLLAWLAWSLSDEATSLITRLVIMVPVLVVAGVWWSQRPLLIALILFAFTLLVAEGRGRPPVLLLVGLLWIGVHGSWPLGLVLLLGRVVGARLDNEDFRRDLRCFGWLAVGILVGGLANPYGPRLLMFPIEILGRRETLSHVGEWQSPSFSQLYARSFLVTLMLLIFAVTRKRSWRTLGPAMLFVAMALVSRRNISMAMLASIPVLATGLPALGRLAATEASRFIGWAGRLVVAAIVIVPILLVRGPDVDFSKYPVEALDAMDDVGLSPAETHVLHPDFVGNYIDLRYGDAGAAWIDDRFELHEETLMADYLMLFSSGPDWREVIDRSGATALLWQRDKPLTQLVREVAGWRSVWSDEHWAVLCRPDVPLCRDLPVKE